MGVRVAQAGPIEVPLRGVFRGIFRSVYPARSLAARQAGEQTAPSLLRQTTKTGVFHDLGRKRDRKRRRQRTPRLSPDASGGAQRPDEEASQARLRVFICHECGTAEPVPWCGQRPVCGHPDCIDALERCAAAHRDPSDPRRFHGPVNLAQIDEHLYAVTDEAR